MTASRPIPGWPRDEQTLAWLRAWLGALRAGDARLAALATAALRRLGVEMRAVPGSTP